MTWRDVLLLLGAYLLGSIPFGYIITRMRTGKDIRSEGSGNIGATNVTRTQGKPWGILTLLLDAAKATAAVLLCAHLSPLGPDSWMGAAGGAAAVVGHCYPVTIGFRGGKGVASGLGAFLPIAPIATLVALAVFILAVAVWRRVALGSILGALAFAASLFILHFGFGRLAQAVPWIGLGLSLLLILRHQENIRRLLAGTEPALWGPGRSEP